MKMFENEALFQKIIILPFPLKYLVWKKNFYKLKKYFPLCKLVKKFLTQIIIHQTHYEKSDWSRAFNQLTIACELDMRNAISAADIAFIMSSSTSAWLLSPLECSPQKQNG